VALLTRIRSVALSPSLLIPLSVAAITFATAYDDGSYYLPSRNTLAIALWWTAIAGLALRTFSLENATRASFALGGLLAALAAWTLASVFWAPSAENAFNEFNRVSLFFGLFVFATLAVRRSSLIAWCNGLAIGISLVTLVALISRFDPGSFSDQGLQKLVQSFAHRLSFPFGYWNGLAIFVSLAIPLLLRAAVSSEKAVPRALAVAPFPAIASVVYLASSRGGVVTAFVGILVFLLLAEQRWTAGAALLWGGLGATVAIVVLNAYNELVNGPLGTDLVKREGRNAAIVVVLCCTLAGAGFAAGREAAARLARRGVLRPKPWFGRATVGVLVALLVVGIVASHPIRQFQAFKRPPAIISTKDFASQHLFSGSGSGRWQFWTASIDQWKAHPVLGDGAGSYGPWWVKHMPADYTQYTQYSHSLYIGSLGQLGILGFALTILLALVGIGIGVRRSLHSAGERRAALATLTAVYTAFAVAAGFDWVWELTVVAGVGIVALALLSGAAATASSPPRLVREPIEPRYARRRRFGLGVAALFAAWLLICAQAIPLFAQLRIRDSQRYAGQGKTTKALQAAMDARNLQPWASSPYLQLALVSETAGYTARAHDWIESAIARDPNNYWLWIVAGRLELKLGDASRAAESYSRAESLYPRSPIFAG